MNVLFFMRNFSGYFRQFEPALREMLDRGHHIHIGRDRDDSMDGREWAAEMQVSYGEQFSYDYTPHPNEDPWYQFKRQVRLTRDYLHFLRPEFDSSPEFTARARKRAPENVVEVFDAHGMQRVPVLEAFSRALYVAEGATPPNPGIERYIAEHDPHIVLLTPHLMPGSLQTEYLRAAQAIGLRTGLCVASWDNLSSKQIIRVRPDVVTVWNETQKREAVEIHDLPPERIAITGAQVYDHWFDWQPRSRRPFCERVGLDPDRAYLLYIGGALFPARITEAEWVTEWLKRLRACDDPRLRDLGVLVRPHPKRAEEWKAVELERFENVAFWPNEGRMPVAAEAKADFYDSMHHSAAVVGINTSAMIEAGIVGRRVHAMLVPEFSGSQLGTLHFSYLTDIAGGLLHISHSFDELFAQLAFAVQEGPHGRNSNRSFIEAFVRPQGIDRASAPLFADAIEQAASAGPAPRTAAGLPNLALRRLLRPRAEGMSKEARMEWELKWAAKGTTHEDERRRKAEKATHRAKKEALHAKRHEDANRRKAEKATHRAEKEALHANRLAKRAEQEARPSRSTADRRTTESGSRAAAANDNVRGNGLDPLDAARTEARRLSKLETPILAGPFLGHTRDELLYWIPFLNWLLGEHPGLRERTTIIGRPGSRGWYAHLGAGWREEPTGGDAGPAGGEVVDPSTALEIVEHLRNRKVLAKSKEKSVFDYKPMAQNELPKITRISTIGAQGIRKLPLPERYAVADLAFDPSLPESDANVRFVAATLTSLAAELPLVLLREPPTEVVPDGAIRLGDSLAAGRGLETAAINSADRFVGTLDGLALLAPFLGVSSTAVYDPRSDPDAQELSLATRVLGGDGLGGFRALAAEDGQPGTGVEPLGAEAR